MCFSKDTGMIDSLNGGFVKTSLASEEFRPGGGGFGLVGRGDSMRNGICECV